MQPVAPQPAQNPRGPQVVACPAHAERGPIYNFAGALGVGPTLVGPARLHP